MVKVTSEKIGMIWCFVGEHNRNGVISADAKLFIDFASDLRPRIAFLSSINVSVQNNYNTK